MGFAGFCAWFIGGLLLIASVDILLQNSFVTSFVAAAIMGVLGSRDN